MQTPLLCWFSVQSCFSAMEFKMKNETMNLIRRTVSVLFFGLLASVMIWRANGYVDPAGYTTMPQLFLCLTGLIFGFTAFSLSLGSGEPEMAE